MKGNKLYIDMNLSFVVSALITLAATFTGAYVGYIKGKSKNKEKGADYLIVHGNKDD